MAKNFKINEKIYISSSGLDNVEKEKLELDGVTDSSNIGLGPANATSHSDPAEINRSRTVQPYYWSVYPSGLSVSSRGCCSLLCDYCNNWTWVVEEILAYGNRLRFRHCREFHYIYIYIHIHTVNMSQLHFA